MRSWWELRSAGPTLGWADARSRTPRVAFAVAEKLRGVLTGVGMTRTGPSRADAELIAALARIGLTVSIYQLERWRRVGALPRNSRRGLGRGRGSTSQVPPETFIRARALASSAQQGRPNLLADPLFVLLSSADKTAAADAKVHAAALDKLAAMRHKLKSGDDRGDTAADARYDAATSVARHMGSDVASIGHLARAALNPDTPDGPPQLSMTGRRAYLQLLAGGPDEAVATELADAVGQLIQLPAPAMDQLREAFGEAEASDDNSLLAIPGLEQIENLIRSTQPDRVRRALEVSSFVQGAVFVLALGAFLNDASRQRLLQVYSHRLWRDWAQYLSPVVRPSGLAATVVSAYVLLREPGLLEAAEGFADLIKSILIVGIDSLLPPFTT